MEVQDTKDLLRALKRFQIFDLEFERHNAMPAFSTLGLVYQYQLHRQHQNFYHPSSRGPRTGASGLLIMSDQSGTHIDALCHQALDLKIFGGIEVNSAVQTPSGFTKHGAEQIPPIIRRGVLVDVPASKNLIYLPEKYEITISDLSKALDFGSICIESDDVVLVRTGYGRFWNDNNQYQKYSGVSKEATSWLGDKSAWALGIDNLSWDVPEIRDPETQSTSFGHYDLIVRRGIHIIENLFLEELSAHKCFEFVFLGFPLKLKGATGSPMRPIALSSG